MTTYSFVPSGDSTALIGVENPEIVAVTALVAVLMTDTVCAE